MRWSLSWRFGPDILRAISRCLASLASFLICDARNALQPLTIGTATLVGTAGMQPNKLMVKPAVRPGPAQQTRALRKERPAKAKARAIRARKGQARESLRPESRQRASTARARKVRTNKGQPQAAPGLTRQLRLRILNKCLTLRLATASVTNLLPGIQPTTAAFATQSTSRTRRV